MNESEKERVVTHAATAHYSEGVMEKATAYCGEIFRRFMKPQGSVLELGPAEGVMTDILYSYFSDYTVVDGADFFVESIVNKYPQIKGYVSLFEDYEPFRLYDNIVLGHVLEHVEDPVRILKMVSSWLAKDGRIVAAVPNSNSIHRQAAVVMGMLEDEKQLNDTDRKNGHRRVYDMDTLKADFLKAGLQIVSNGGYWLKPLSNGQINSSWDGKMVDAFLKMGEKYPEIAGEIYIIATV